MSSFFHIIIKFEYIYIYIKFSYLKFMNDENLDIYYIKTISFEILIYTKAVLSKNIYTS